VAKVKPLKKEPYMPRPSVLACGFDISMSVIAGSAKMYDGVLNRMRGPVWYEYRFKPEDDYFTRMRIASIAHEHILDMVCQIKGCVFELDEIHIAVEEPVPFGMIKKGNSQSIKQQIEINGAFLGGLCRWGYKNLYQVNVKTWRGLVAEDFEMKQNKEFDKFTVVEWAKELYPDIPDWPDLIRTNKGLVAKPKTSVAKPAQPDDRYDATGIMEWCFDTVAKENKLKTLAKKEKAELAQAK
jgi:hypothetical protein